MREVGEFILKQEGRFKNGQLRVYPLPPGDGGGTYEVAGINDRYHPRMAARLKSLIESGQHETAYHEAVAYIYDYVKGVESYRLSKPVTAFLMDCQFNRGPRGAALILQQALKQAGVYFGELDGKVGQGTQVAARGMDDTELILRLLLSRAWYERAHARRDESSPFWRGLNNRWVEAAKFSLNLQHK